MYTVKEEIESYIEGRLMEIYHMTYEWKGDETVLITEDERNVGYSYPVPKREPTRHYSRNYSELSERIKTALSNAKDKNIVIDLGILKQ
ncbi:MAG: hypothetical protein AAF298_08045 [Cyanobacteria bacterium P01_A01_bin.40]